MTANNEAVKEVSALTLCTSCREQTFSETEILLSEIPGNPLA
jgi:hypothetical protein